MVTMDSLTTGQVAGIIATGIFVVNISFKLLWPLILVGMLNMNESAVTWSKVTPHLQASFWPTILRTDSTATNGVRMGIRFSLKMGTLSALLLSLASIITPLGLYESIAPEGAPQNVEFDYSKDSSVFGVGTLPRPAEGFSRVCGGFGGPVACPGSNSTVLSNHNSTGIYISGDDVISVTVPSDYMAYLQSGTQAIGQTVSSIFDIGYRTYSYNTDVNLNTTNDGKRYAVGSFDQFNTLFLDEGYQIVEGLIVDTRGGRIGFRNHTVPVASKFGATWTEDILFIEPQTECVNTNLTFEWTLPLNDSIGVKDLVLVDNGGFENINHTFPPYDSITAQEDPQLAYRAYRSAWFNNAYTALYYNVTNPGSSISGMKAFSYINSNIGKQFPMIVSNTSGTSDWSYKHFSVAALGDYIDGVPSSDFNGSVLNSTTGFDLNVPDNPWQVTTDNFTDAQSACNAVFGSSLGNMSNILGICGTILTAPQQKGPQSVVRFEPGSSYIQPMYGCASAVRAVIKTVSFQFNGTGLAGLSVTDIQDKKYDNEQAYPTWGVETADMRLSDGSPLWGLIAPDQKEKFKDMSFVQKPDLWLPGYIDSFGAGLSAVSESQNLPGVDFYSYALSMAYSTGSVSSSSLFDYSGANNLGVYNKWANMSKTPEGAANIINLIWTDVAANAIVGTKSWLPESNTLTKRADGSTQQVLVPVNQYTRRVRYHLLYAIPAFIVLAIFVSVFCFSFVMAILGQAGPSRMKAFLTRTSVGRVITSLLHPGDLATGAPTKVWAQRLGKMYIDLMGNVPRGATVGQHPAAMSSEVYDPMLGVKGPASIGLQEVKR